MQVIESASHSLKLNCKGRNASHLRHEKPAHFLLMVSSRQSSYPAHMTCLSTLDGINTILEGIGFSRFAIVNPIYAYAWFVLAKGVQTPS